MDDEKEGESPGAGAFVQQNRGLRVRFIREWHAREAAASSMRQLASEAEAKRTAAAGPKRKMSGEAEE